MRNTLHRQLVLTLDQIGHQHAQELKLMSDILDHLPVILDLVMRDLCGEAGAARTGRNGMTAEQVLRALVIKQMHSLSYDDLAFHLTDSSSFRAFVRVGSGTGFGKSALQENISKLGRGTLEEINRHLVSHAVKSGAECGRKIRFDCTVTDANIHEPTDSSLLYDTTRVVCRLLARLQRDGWPVKFRDRTRQAKRAALAVLNAKDKEQRKKHYKYLLKITSAAVVDANKVIDAVSDDFTGPLRHFMDLGKAIIDQTTRRIIKGESVPSAEKVVSLFEDHCDIIVKDKRETLYGHKICLATGSSNLVLDLVVHKGNPADSTMAVDMVRRQIKQLGKAPWQVAMDGGFASRDNLTEIKKLGVSDVAFAKGRGLEVTEMVKSSWVYKKLRNFRAGVEANISFLKRCFGLGRCNWRGMEGFVAYCWSSAIAANLLVLARHMLTE